MYFLWQEIPKGRSYKKKTKDFFPRRRKTYKNDVLKTFYFFFRVNDAKNTVEFTKNQTDII